MQTHIHPSFRFGGNTTVDPPGEGEDAGISRVPASLHFANLRHSVEHRLKDSSVMVVVDINGGI